MLTTAVTVTSTETWFWITTAEYRIKSSLPHKYFRNLSAYELRKKVFKHIMFNAQITSETGQIPGHLKNIFKN